MAVDWGTIVGIVVGLLTLWLVILAILWLARPRDANVRELIRVVPDVVRLVRRLLRDGAVPLAVRVALVGLLIWLVNPIDLIPEFIPVLGPIDDVVVAVLVLRFVRRRLGDEELERRWPGTPEGYRLLLSVTGGVVWSD